MKVTVIGADTSIGSAVANRLSSFNNQVIRIGEEIEAGVDRCPTHILDIDRTLGYVLGSSAIVYCATPAPELFASNPDMFRLKAAVTVHYLASLVQLTGAQLVYCSRWEVYGKPLKIVGEEDCPKPNTEFSNYLFFWESALKQALPETTIVRIADVWGCSSRFPGIIDTKLHEIARTGIYYRFDDEHSYFPMISIQDAANAISEIVWQNPRGVILNCYQQSVNYFAWCETLPYKSRPVGDCLAHSADMRGINFSAVYSPVQRLDEKALEKVIKEKIYD